MLQIEEIINKNFIEAQNLEKLEESKPKTEKKEEKPEKKEVRIPGPTLNPSLCTSPKTMAFFHINKVKVNPNNEEQRKLMENKIKNEELNNSQKIISNAEKNKKIEKKQETNNKIISLLTSSVPLENNSQEKKIKFKVEESKKNYNTNINNNNIDMGIYEPYSGYDFDFDISNKQEEKKFLEKKTMREYNTIQEIPSYSPYKGYSFTREKIDSGTQTMKYIDNRSVSCERMNENPIKEKILNLINEYTYQEVFDALMKYYFPNYVCDYSIEVINKIANLVNDISLDQIVSCIISIGNSREEVIKVNMKPYKEKELSSQEEEIDYEDKDEENDTIEIMEH